MKQLTILTIAGEMFHCASLKDAQEILRAIGAANLTRLDKKYGFGEDQTVLVKSENGFSASIEIGENYYPVDLEWNKESDYDPCKKNRSEIPPDKEPDVDES